VQQRAAFRRHRIGRHRGAVCPGEEHRVVAVAHERHLAEEDVRLVAEDTPAHATPECVDVRPGGRAFRVRVGEPAVEVAAHRRRIASGRARRVADRGLAVHVEEHRLHRDRTLLVERAAQLVQIALLDARVPEMLVGVDDDTPMAAPVRVQDHVDPGHAVIRPPVPHPGRPDVHVRALEQQRSGRVLRVVVDEQEPVDTKALVVVEEEREALGFVLHRRAQQHFSGRDRQLTVVDACQFVVCKRGVDTVALREQCEDTFVRHAAREMIGGAAVELLGVRAERVVVTPLLPQFVAAFEGFRTERAQLGGQGAGSYRTVTARFRFTTDDPRPRVDPRPTRTPQAAGRNSSAQRRRTGERARGRCVQPRSTVGCSAAIASPLCAGAPRLHRNGS
jgi:hypothetical protein